MSPSSSSVFFQIGTASSASRSRISGTSGGARSRVLARMKARRAGVGRAHIFQRRVEIRVNRRRAVLWSIVDLVGEALRPSARRPRCAAWCARGRSPRSGAGSRCGSRSNRSRRPGNSPSAAAGTGSSRRRIDTACSPSEVRTSKVSFNSSCEIVRRVGAVVAPRHGERVLLDEIEDRHRALVVDLDRRRAESSPRRARPRTAGRDDRSFSCAHGPASSASRIATERACASSASASPSAIAAGPSAASERGVAFEQRRALHEVEHAEPGGEARRARRRQHVVGAADIVADRLGRMRAEEDRAGVVDPLGERLGSRA